MPLKVILDSSFLMIPFRFKIDIFAEIEYLLKKKVDFVVPAAVKNELAAISARGGEGAADASLALQLASRCRVVDVTPNSGETVDETIIRASRKRGCIAATADSDLRSKLREAKIPVLFLREKSRIELEGLDPAYM